MKKMIVRKNKLRTVCVYILTEVLVFASLQNVGYAENAADYVSIPPLINTSSSGDKPNVLFVLDNSNSMDEAPSGQAVGSANAGSKSEIARNAVKDIIATYSRSARMGLMAYQQGGVGIRRLHDSQYDVSYDPANYDPNFEGDRASATKRYRIPNPADSGSFMYYNVALPFYSNSNSGTQFCYSSTADFDNGSESESSGPWDRYTCYSSKTGTSDAFSGFSNRTGRYSFAPTDSDFAQGILDFGTHLNWQYVGSTWFSNSSPGEGYLHVEIADVDTAQLNRLNQKLAQSQFTNYTDTPLRNAGLTPVEGSLQSAADYFAGTLSSSESVTGNTPSAPPTNTCEQQDYVILVTDGLPNVDENGNLVTNTSTAIAGAAAKAAELLEQGVRTYVIGFALPTGVDGELLNTIASAGGTGSTYLAGNSEALLNSLESIFLSFANREASSSSSAVLANNSRGEGAVFQAIYSPQKEDRLGNEVSWVGSLFGLFLDENGYLREDSDGDHVLDDYLTDKVVHYYFDAGLGKTQVKLFYGSDATTPPSDVANAAPLETIDVEDIAVLWEARDQLGEVSDVLTQRSYSVDASTGRYIITSIDGTSTLDFVQVSQATIDDDINSQSAAADALADAQSIFDVASAQHSAAQESIDDLAGQLVTATSARDQAQVDVSTAVTAVTDAETGVIDAQAGLTAAQVDVAGAEAGVIDGQVDVVQAQAGVTDAQVDVTGAQAVVTGAQAGVTDAQTSAANAQIGVSDAQTGVIDAQQDLTAAQEGVVDAQVDVDGAQTSVIGAQTNLTGAQAGAANAQIGVTDAQTDVGNAQTDLTGAQADATVAAEALAVEIVSLLAAIAAGEPVAIAAAQVDVDTAQAALDADQFIVDTAQTDLGTAQSSLASSQASLDVAQASADTAQAALDVAQVLLGTSQASLTTAQVSLTTAQTDLSTAQTALAIAQTTSDTAQANLGDAQVVLDTAQAALDIAQATLDTTQAILDTAQADLVAAQADLAAVQAAQAAAQADLVAAQEVLVTANTGLTDAQAALDTMVESLTDAQAQYVGAVSLLVPVLESLNLAQSSLYAAQANYDQETADVMGNGTLINYLDVSTVEQAYNTVKYVRGEEVDGFRSRMLDYDDDDGQGTLEPWRLGDIVHSSPALVGAPSDLYDAKYRDKTYGEFRELYKNRRNVLYVGANDGMLHAFNAGFWDLSNKSFEESNSFAGGNATAHPLGSELWAYVPRSSLPHLQWMTNPNYAHAYYVDGSPVVFDANIFTADATHPFGWGTVLIIGMRFGGGDIQIDVDADGSDDTWVRSSYALFDVTNPEEAPVFMGELSEPGFGYTTSVPTVVKKRVKGTDYRSPVQNDWYVAFGSGPTELDDASSTQNAGLYLYDLRARQFVSGFDPLNVRSSSFIGDITSYDSGKDFVDDTLYYGVSGGAPASGSNGALLRTRLDQPAVSSTSTVIDTQEPVLSAPVVQVSRFGRRRITFGTGRLFMSPDNVTRESRHYFGVVEPLDGSGALTYTTILQADLEDVTDIDVFDDGLISRSGGTVEIPNGNDVETFRELVQAIRLNLDGWVLELDESGGAPSERSISPGATANNVLFFTTYTPSINSCLPEGTSELYGVDVRTGTAIPFEVFAVDDDPDSSEGNIVESSLELGQGLASAPIVIHNSGGTTVFTSKSTTEQLNKVVRTSGVDNGRQSWRQLILE